MEEIRSYKKIARTKFCFYFRPEKKRKHPGSDSEGEDPEYVPGKIFRPEPGICVG